MLCIPLDSLDHQILLWSKFKVVLVHKESPKASNIAACDVGQTDNADPIGEWR